MLYQVEMPVRTAQMWEEEAKKFENRWNFPHCMGAIDGKHVQVACPKNTGSIYHNYKGTFSIVLMAISGADYRFSMIDVGGYGSSNDSGIWNNCAFAQRLQAGTLDIPEPCPLPNATDETDFPYIFVGDEAFPLKVNLQRPYPRRDLHRDERIYNYRLSRARRVVENAFGLLASRWRLMQGRIFLSPEKVDSVIKACCVLHNFLTKEGDPLLQRVRLAVAQNEFNVEESAMVEIDPIRGIRASARAHNLRTYMKHYFCSTAGAVPWQNERAHVKDYESKYFYMNIFIHLFLNILQVRVTNFGSYKFVFYKFWNWFSIINGSKAPPSYGI